MPQFVDLAARFRTVEMTMLNRCHLFIALAFTATGLDAQQFTDAASYDAWKASIAPDPVEGTGPLDGPMMGQRSNCDCWIEPDASYTTVNNQTQWNAAGFNNADDGNHGPVNLPFGFQLYSNVFNQAYISTNGILVFGGTYVAFTAQGLPMAPNRFVAPFWADIDLRGPGANNNIVKYKVTPTAMYVNYINVGYFSQHVDKVNTFQVIITNATDPVAPNGANVSFCYRDMQWTTGDVNGGANGFGGNGANVGANQGNGVNYLQFGRFNQPGTAYNGPFGAPGGVSWLDGQHFLFNTIQTSANVPPVVSSTTVCDTIEVCVGVATPLEVTFLSPEPGQITTPSISAPTMQGWATTSLVTGNTATASGVLTATTADIGFHTITFSGADNGQPPLTSTHDVVIHVLPLTIVDTVDFAVCDDSAPTNLFDAISSVANLGGEWFDPNDAPSSGIFTPGSDPDGIYMYTAAISSQACPAIAVAVITSQMDHVSDINPPLCNGSGNGNLQVSTTGNAGPWNYAWFDASGHPVGIGSGTSSTFAGGAGQYTVIITEGINGAGCSDTLLLEILEPEPLAWVGLPHDTLICLTGTALLSASAIGGTGAINYQWSSGASGPGPHGVSPAAATQYTVVAIDANGCAIGPVGASIDVRPPLTLDPLTSDTTCFNVPLSLHASGYSGGDGAYLFNWGSGPQPLDSIVTLVPSSTNICVTLIDGCETPPLTSCAWVEVLQAPPIQLSADTTIGCVPLSVQFALRDTTGGAMVHWRYGDGNELLGDSVSAHTYAGAGNFTVSLTIAWPNGCVSDTAFANIVSTFTIPIAQATWNPRPATINDPVVRFMDLSIPNVVNWQWDFGAFGTSDERDPVIEYPNDIGGAYPFVLVVANALGCTDTLRAWVNVDDEFMVWVPNAFTPNEEGGNEEFFISGTDLSPEGFEFLVFDRWGGLIYSTTELGFRWDGFKDGQRLPQGVYPYRLKVESLSTPKKRTIHGHVNLLR